VFRRVSGIIRSLERAAHGGRADSAHEL